MNNYAQNWVRLGSLVYAGGPSLKDRQQFGAGLESKD